MVAAPFDHGAVDAPEARVTARSMRRRHPGSEGHFLLTAEPFSSQEVTLAPGAPPVRDGLDSWRKARGRALRCLRVWIRTKARHCSRCPRWANRALALVAPASVVRVPPDAIRRALASVEGGQIAGASRPAAGVGSWRAH